MSRISAKVLSFDELQNLWRDLENREFTSEEEASMAKREIVESRIAAALSTFGRDGWDYQIDNFGPPCCVVRVSLMNRVLHRCEVIEAVVNAFDAFAPPWVLDLGFVDAIEHNVWKHCDDVGRLVVTSSEFFLDERLAQTAHPCLRMCKTS
jgi:hypothetical protein